jgi:hypothetical protein
MSKIWEAKGKFQELSCLKSLTLAVSVRNISGNRGGWYGCQITLDRPWSDTTNRVWSDVELAVSITWQYQSTFRTLDLTSLSLLRPCQQQQLTIRDLLALRGGLSAVPAWRQDFTSTDPTFLLCSHFIFVHASCHCSSQFVILEYLRGLKCHLQQSTLTRQHAVIFLNAGSMVIYTLLWPKGDTTTRNEVFPGDLPHQHSRDIRRFSIFISI